jgi:hypothetical protein
MNVFLTSGFTPRSSGRTPAQPPAQPAILSVDQGISGQLLASVKAVRNAKTYELRIGPVGPGGATPVSWVTQTVSKVKPAAPINSLTPEAALKELPDAMRLCEINDTVLIDGDTSTGFNLRF